MLNFFITKVFSTWICRRHFFLVTFLFLIFFLNFCFYQTWLELIFFDALDTSYYSLLFTFPYFKTQPNESRAVSQLKSFSFFHEACKALSQMNFEISYSLSLNLSIHTYTHMGNKMPSLFFIFFDYFYSCFRFELLSLEQ